VTPRNGQVDLTVSYLPGETIDEMKAKETRPVTDAELNQRYIREGVRIVVEQARYPLAQILAMFTDTFITATGEKVAKYKRDPEYQRRHRWDDGRRSRLIESFLMNVPVPPIFLYEYELARFEVMDGRQRLTALMDFYADRLELTDLQHWPELNGRTYSTLPASIRDGIDRRYLSSIILLNETSAASAEQAAFLKKLVFERLNSGGVRLSGQETRNAVYNGPLNDLCLKLSRTTELRAMLGTPADPEALVAAEDSDAVDPSGQDAGLERDANGVVVTNLGRSMFDSMEDVEMVLRFYAYRHMSKFSQGLNRIAEFLDVFLAQGNQFDPATLLSYEQLFLDNIRFWHQVAGPTAFQVKGSNRHFSKIAYDALMYASSALDSHQKNMLSSRPAAVLSAIDEMYDTDGAAFGGRKTNTADARRRNELALKALGIALAAAVSN